MRHYYKCKSKSIYTELAQGAGAVDSSTVIAASGTRVCLRSFELSSGAPVWNNLAVTQASPAYVYFEKMDASNTEILKMPFSSGGRGNLVDIGGGSLSPSSFLTIPGPGVLFDDGMRVRVTIPSNAAYMGPAYALINVVYSL